MPTSDPNTTGEDESRDADSLTHIEIVEVSNRRFNDWYDERQIEQNILEGKSYFNGPSPAKDPEVHTPSKLLQCHRKASYARQNAPREGPPPEGLFWIGSEFEEQVIVPFLRDAVTGEDTYVQNSLWIDETIETDEEELRLRGSTDPAIVTQDADPILLTEVKTTTSIEHLDEPKEHHRAQLHAYLHALTNENNDSSVIDGLLLYGSRETLDIKAFHVPFDTAFWQRIVEWMATQTAYEAAEELPPADPEREWECSYCSFQHRCGKADTPYKDIGYDGLLPLFTDYDRQNLTEYLEGHANVGAKLTPALAHVYPDLVETYGAYDWSCPRCQETYVWDAVEWDGNTDDPPFCSACLSDGHMLTLSGPEPIDQLTW